MSQGHLTVNGHKLYYDGCLYSGCIGYPKRVDRVASDVKKHTETPLIHKLLLGFKKHKI